VSVALAILTARAAVVATDGGRTEDGGIQRSDCDKTLAIGDWLIGCQVGVVEFCGASIAEHVRSALGEEPLPASTVLERLVDYFSKGLVQIPESEIAERYRGLELLVAVRGHGELAYVEFRAGKLVSARPMPLFAVTGDDKAAAVAASELRALEKTLNDASIIQLKSIARSLIPKAVAACGPYPTNPGLPSCIGGPYLRALKLQ
jgi:hypothetical protein